MPEDPKAYANRPDTTQRAGRRVFIAPSEYTSARLVREAARHLADQGYHVVSWCGINASVPGTDAQRREHLRQLIDCDTLAVMPHASLHQLHADVHVQMALHLGMTVLQINLLDAIRSATPTPTLAPSGADC